MAKIIPFGGSVKSVGSKKRKPRKKSTERHVPNFCYKPKGKASNPYFGSLKNKFYLCAMFNI